MCNSNQKHTALSYLNGVNITGSRWTLHEKKNRIKYLNLVISKQKRSASERITNSTGNSAPRCQPGHSVHCVLYSAAHHCSNNTCKCPLERSLDTSAQLNIETDKSSRTAHSLTPGGKREKRGRWRLSVPPGGRIPTTDERRRINASSQGWEQGWHMPWKLSGRCHFQMSLSKPLLFRVL